MGFYPELTFAMNVREMLCQFQRSVIENYKLTIAYCTSVKHSVLIIKYLLQVYFHSTKALSVNGNWKTTATMVEHQKAYRKHFQWILLCDYMDICNVQNFLDHLLLTSMIEA